MLMRHKHIYIFTLLILLTPKYAVSKPVNMLHVFLSQPDGSRFEAIINGDEFASTITDTEGRSIIKNKDGYYCYALYNTDGSKYSTGYIVGEKTPANIMEASKKIPYDALRKQAAEKRGIMTAEIKRKALLSGKTAKDAGIKTKEGPINKHCVVLLVQFRDKSFKYTKADFEALVSQPGYSFNGATGSVKDYFNAQFRGDYIFNFTLSDIITLDKNCGYYFADEGGKKDVRAHLAVKEACEKADAAGMDFSAFDADGDGEVDNVFLFVAGRDQADGGGEDCVWSHQYYLKATTNLAIDGKIINTYAVTTELRLAPDNSFPLAGIGVFCHEYSHTLGLMDMYDTDGLASGGYGNGLWSSLALMDGGNSNNNTNTPPNYNAVDYDMLGLGTPAPLTSGQHYLAPISQNRGFFKMETGNNGEYYLLECRDNEGWDSHIGGKGLIIYHIDKSRKQSGYSDSQGRDLTAEERWLLNEVNCRPLHQCAELVSATPGISAYTPEGYYANNAHLVFYPSTVNNAFSPATEPRFVFWDGTESPLAISDIKFNGNSIEFNVVNISGIDIPSVKPGRHDIFQDAAIIQWEASIPSYTGSSYISYGKSGEEPVTIEVLPYQAGKYAVILEGLSSRTAYRTSIVFKEGGISGPAAALNFTTKSLYDVEPYIFLYGVVQRNSDGSFPKNSLIPLRIYNLRGAYSVQWFFDDKEIPAPACGYYELVSSGQLKAVVTYADGSKDIIQKTIIVK